MDKNEDNPGGADEGVLCEVDQKGTSTILFQDCFRVVTE